MNTKVEYLYRDASNYKVHNEAVIKGTLTTEQIEEIMSCRDCAEYFIPQQVGLPEKRFGKITEDDHCWFEICKEGFSETDQVNTVDLTAEELYRNFLAASGNWDEWAWLRGVEIE